MQKRIHPSLENADEVLMRHFQAGEQEAFKLLFERYAAPLVNFAFRFLHSRCESEDIAQEVFLRIYNRKDRYDANRPFRPWLYSIASRLTTDRLRRRKRYCEVPIDAIPENEDHHPFLAVLWDKSLCGPYDILEKEYEAQKVRKALEILPENQRIAVLLARFENMSYEEITQTMNLSITAVKSLLFRAKQTLKHVLAPELPTNRQTTIQVVTARVIEAAINN